MQNSTTAQTTTVPDISDKVSRSAPASPIPCTRPKIKATARRRTLPADPDQIRAGYLKKFNAHQQGLKTLCDTLGILHHLLPTDRPLETALHTYLSDRRSRAPRVSRSRSS